MEILRLDDRFDLVEEKEARLKEDLEIFQPGQLELLGHKQKRDSFVEKSTCSMTLFSNSIIFFLDPHGSGQSELF